MRNAQATGPGRLTPALVPLLAQFAAVAREEHLTRAAEELGVSQPTLSRAMTRLEAQLGVPLFLHVGRGIRLTPQGRRLLDRAEAALAVLDLADRELASEADAEYGLIRLAHLKSLGARVIPSLLKRFHALHPHVRFDLTETSSRRMEDLLRTGEADLCLLSPPSADPGIESVPLRRQEMRPALPTGHRWADRDAVRLTDAASEPFVAMPEGYGTRALADELCRTVGFTPRLAFTANDTDTIRGLVAAGLGIALLPYEGISHPGTVDLRLINPGPAHRATPSRTLSVAWSAHAVHPAAVTLFRAFLLESAGNETQGRSVGGD
jgi:DNA-binding transcriptional LysR family regulator